MKLRFIDSIRKDEVVLHEWSFSSALDLHALTPQRHGAVVLPGSRRPLWVSNVTYVYGKRGLLRVDVETADVL